MTCRRTALAALATTLLVSGVAQAQIQLQGMMAAFGAVGIAAGQTARLTVVLGTAEDGSMASCDVDAAIMNGTGGRLAGAPMTVRSGEAAQVEYAVPVSSRSRVGLTAPGRIQIRATAKAGVGPSPFGPDPTPLGPDPSPFRPCGVPMLASLEIYDTQTLQTAVVVHPAVLVGFNPQPDPPMPEAQ